MLFRSEMKVPSGSTIECSLTFQSPDTAIIKLHFKHIAEDEDQSDGFAEMYSEVFSQACRTIQDLALLTNIKRLRICHIGIYYIQVMRVTGVGQLFKSVGPLEELVLHHCSVQAYLAPFFPPTKELTISHPLQSTFVDFDTAMGELAKSQHALGVPFERVTVRMDRLPVEMAEMLRPWVGAVHCYEEDVGKHGCACEGRMVWQAHPHRTICTVHYY